MFLLIRHEIKLYNENWWTIPLSSHENNFNLNLTEFNEIAWQIGFANVLMSQINFRSPLYTFTSYNQNLIPKDLIQY